MKGLGFRVMEAGVQGMPRTSRISLAYQEGRDSGEEDRRSSELVRGESLCKAWKPRCLQRGGRMRRGRCPASNTLYPKPFAPFTNGIASYFALLHCRGGRKGRRCRDGTHSALRPFHLDARLGPRLTEIVQTLILDVPAVHHPVSPPFFPGSYLHTPPCLFILLNQRAGNISAIFIIERFRN